MLQTFEILLSTYLPASQNLVHTHPNLLRDPATTQAQLPGPGRDTEEVAAVIPQEPGNLLHIASAGRGLVGSALRSPVARAGPAQSSLPEE